MVHNFTRLQAGIPSGPVRVALFNRCSDANASAPVRFAYLWAMVSPGLAGWFRLRWQLVSPASEDRSTRQLP